MSALDKVIAAVTPPVSDEKRMEARRRAKEAARPGSWFALVLQHHEALDAAFARIHAAQGAGERELAFKAFETLLTGHSIAEEAVIYPALAQAGQKGHANLAYTEQVAAKMQTAALEVMDPLSEDFHDKLGHLQGAVQTHMYQEESDWMLDLSQSTEVDQGQITARYVEEFNRYMGQDARPLAA